MNWLGCDEIKGQKYSEIVKFIVQCMLLFLIILFYFIIEVADVPPKNNLKSTFLIVILGYNIG